MKLRDLLLSAPVKPTEATNTPDVAASYLPLNNIDVFNAYFVTNITATREEAMAVPTIARARNIICSTVASLPLETRVKSTGERIESPRIINQPDSRVPGSAVYAWLAEDLLFYGFAYLKVLSRYAEDGRVRDAERIAPSRVEIITNQLSTEIVGYRVDGVPISNNDLKVFVGLDEGILNRAGKTIKAAAALESAAVMYAKEPAPMMILKSNGTALPADRIRTLLDAFAKSRKERATAFLNADVALEKLGLDPKSLQLNEARQYVSLELCRQIGLPAWFASSEQSSMTYSNAINQRRDLIDFSIRPLLVAIEQRLSMNDFTAQGQVVRYALDDFLRGNPLERAQVYEILTRIGAMTVDEVRRDEDLLA